MRIYHILSIFIALTLGVVSFIPLAGYGHYIAEIIEQGRFQLILAIFIVFLVFLGKKSYIYAGILCFLLFFNGFWVLSAYFPQKNPVFCEKSIDFRLFTYNVYFKNYKYDEIIRLLDEYDPDVVTMQEALEGFYAYAKEELDKRYPFMYPDRKNSFWGPGMLLSKYPIVSIESSKLPHSRKEVLSAVLDIKGRQVHLYNIHTTSPITQERAVDRNKQIELFGEFIAGRENSNNYVILTGDFNTAPWHRSFKKMKEIIGLQGNKWFEGIASWPSWLPAIFRVPIDHILFSPNITYDQYKVARGAGSDHMPLYAEIRLCQ